MANCGPEGEIEMDTTESPVNNSKYTDEIGDELPLTAREIGLLDNNHQSFVDILELKELLGSMYSSKLINETQMETIFSKPTSYEKNDALLKFLRRLSLRDFLQTIGCLRESQQNHIAETLEKGGVVLRVHVHLNAQNETDDDKEIVRKLENVLNERSIEQSNRIPGLVQSKVIAAKVCVSIMLYIYCKVIEDLQQLNKSLTSGRLRESVAFWLNSILNRSKKIGASALTVFPEQFKKMQTPFGKSRKRKNATIGRNEDPSSTTLPHLEEESPSNVDD